MPRCCTATCSLTRYDNITSTYTWSVPRLHYIQTQCTGWSKRKPDCFQQFVTLVQHSLHQNVHHVHSQKHFYCNVYVTMINMFDTKAQWWKCCETLHSESDVCRPAVCIFQFVITNYNDTVCVCYATWVPNGLRPVHRVTSLFGLAFRRDQRLRPKLNLSDKVWSQNRLWISWSDVFGLVVGWSKRLSPKL